MNIWACFPVSICLTYSLTGFHKKILIKCRGMLIIPFCYHATKNNAFLLIIKSQYQSIIQAIFETRIIIAFTNEVAKYNMVKFKKMLIFWNGSKFENVKLAEQIGY